MPSESGKMLWINSTQSGLGDRILNTFFVLVVARKLGMSLYLDWKPYHPPCGQVPDYRKRDILIENLKSCLILPSDLHIVDNIFSLPREADLLYTGYSGHSSSNEFYEEHDIRLAFPNPSDFERAVADAMSEIRFDEHLFNTTKTSSPDVSVHIRRTDKVRPLYEKDSLMISTDELCDLDQRTWKWIESLAKEHKTFYVCGDDAVAVDTYNRRIAEMGLAVFNPDSVNEDWKKTFLDLAVMASSKIVLQSQRNSSFSKTASMIGKNRLINVYMDAL